MSRRWLVLGAALFMGAPAFAQEPVQTDASAAEAAEPTPAADAAPAPDGVPAPKWLVGQWKVVLPPEQQAQMDTLRMAFRDPPPTEEELAALSTEEQAMVGMVLMAREMDPDGEEVANMRAMVDALDEMQVTFTEDRVSMLLGPETMDTEYRVLSVKGKQARISVRGEQGWEESTARKGKGKGDIVELVEDDDEVALTLTR